MNVSAARGFLTCFRLYQQNIVYKELFLYFDKRTIRFQFNLIMAEKLPDELYQLVENFKRFIREQKAYKDQKFEVDPILEVGREVDEFNLALQRLAIDSTTNTKIVQQIRNDTAKLLRHAELAYSQLATNQQLQQQQQQPQQQQQYFQEIADQFESRMRAYGEQIKELKMSLDSITRTYNADELFKWLKKQHEALGEIAAKIYMSHEMIMEKHKNI